MARRIAKGWLVISSREDETATCCVDIFRRGDGTFGFETFRRDPEDQGVWTAVGGTVDLVYPSADEADAAARAATPWLASYE
jgi:hypothetical protein